MIKKLVAILPLLLLGCAPAKPPVSIQSCDAIYLHILDISAWDVMKQDPQFESYSVLTALGFLDKDTMENVHKDMVPKVDAVYQKRGTTKRFYSFCTQHMTEPQAKTLDEINTCTQKATR
jgi:hypothetical protein